MIQCSQKVSLNAPKRHHELFQLNSLNGTEWMGLNFHRSEIELMKSS